MANYIKVAATSRMCASLPEDVGAEAVDRAVLAYLAAVFGEVRPQKPDLIVLPELCDMPAGWDMRAYARYIAAGSGAVSDYVREKARELGAWIAFSTLRRTESGALRNSCLLLNRRGEAAAVYDKINPTLGELELGVEAGEAPLVVVCELGRIGFAICFDLNYTALAEEYRKQKAELILFPALFHGGLLQNTWALTARSYLAGACGGCGASIVAPTGQLVQSSTRYYSEIVSAVNLDYALLHLDFNKEKLARAVRTYGEAIRIQDPGELGTVMLTSESGSVTVSDLIEEFKLEPLDDYLRRVKRRGL